VTEKEKTNFITLPLYHLFTPCLGTLLVLVEMGEKQANETGIELTTFQK